LAGSERGTIRRSWVVVSDGEQLRALTFKNGEPLFQREGNELLERSLLDAHFAFLGAPPVNNCAP
jgi:hypothetical protein